VWLFAGEKAMLEAAARRGFGGLSEFLRMAALDAAR
jgi:hypothetical protein